MNLYFNFITYQVVNSDELNLKMINKELNINIKLNNLYYKLKMSILIKSRSPEAPVSKSSKVLKNQL
jgi:hypothetical protein